MFAPDEALSKLPPTLIITDGRDTLCKEAELLAARLIEDGVIVIAKRFTCATRSFTIRDDCPQATGARELIRDMVALCFVIRTKA